jgi:RHS repeat-associated protein
MMQPQRPLYVLSGTKVLPFVVILSFSLLNAAQVTAGGAWTKVLSYDAYGNALGFDPSTAITNLQYNTESYDANTGMQYLRSRWYDPSSGRFAALDSFGGFADWPATLNGFGYCGANPISWADPSGMFYGFNPVNVQIGFMFYGAAFACIEAGGDQLEQGNVMAAIGMFEAGFNLAYEGAMIILGGRASEPNVPKPPNEPAPPGDTVPPEAPPEGTPSPGTPAPVDVPAAGTRGGTYLLRDADTGQVMRTGRTGDLLRRETEHARDPLLKDYEFEPVHRTDVYEEQRGLEQILHDQYNPPLNKINPIRPTNPNLPDYLDAARRYLNQ